MYSLQHWAQALPSVQCLNRFDTRNLLFSTKSLCAEQNQFHKALELKPQPNMSLVQVGLDLLFDKRCLIMGFSTKPVSIAALQSTFLCRSADPSLGVRRMACMICSGLLKLVISQGGGKVKARTTKRSCHQSRARDLYPQCHRREKGVILRRPLPLSLPRNTQVSTCMPHLNFNACLKLSSAHTHTHTHRVCSSIFQEKAHFPTRLTHESWICVSGRCLAIRPDLSEGRMEWIHFSWRCLYEARCSNY